MVDTLVSLARLYHPVPYLHMLPWWRNLSVMLPICTVFALAPHTRISVYLNTSAHTHWSDYKEHCVLLLQTSAVHVQQPIF